MKRTPTLRIALALVVLIPAVALAGPGFGPRGDRGDGPGRHFLPPPGYLDLTDEQIDAAQVIRDDLRQQVQALHQDHAALRQQLRDLLDGDNPDPAAVGELVIELHGERGQLRDALTAADAEFSTLLTEEQLVKWENFKELRGRRGHRGSGAGRGEGHGPRGGFGGPPGG
ncbi:MAG: Spy/CpxP family protein refolding chaperone [Thermoanaerobaculia bacterium]